MTPHGTKKALLRFYNPNGFLLDGRLIIYYGIEYAKCTGDCYWRTLPMRLVLFTLRHCPAAPKCKSIILSLMLTPSPQSPLPPPFRLRPVRWYCRKTGYLFATGL